MNNKLYCLLKFAAVLLTSAPFLAILSASAKVFKLETPVRAAILYYDGASIVRRATLEIAESGNHQLIIDVPTLYDVEQIAVKIEGAQLLSQTLTNIVKNENSELQLQLQEKQLQLQACNQKIHHNEKIVAALIHRMQNFRSSYVKISEAINALESEHRAKFAEKEQLIKEIAQIEALLKWQQETVQDSQMKHQLQLNIDVKQAGTLQLELRERSDRASWQPSSEWHLNTQSKQLQIVAQARIQQQSGLDWQNVQLTLAVTPPHYYMRPVLEPQTVTFAEEMQKLSTNFASSAAKISDVAMLADIPNKESMAQISSTGSDFIVTLPATYNLQSSFDSHLVNYYKTSVSAEIVSDFYSWAWFANSALLVANWQQPKDFSLLPGRMKLYRDGLFLSERYQNGIFRQNSTQKISFGEDARISAKVISKPQYQENEGVIIRDKLLQKEAIIAVTNNSDEDIDLRVYALLPISLIDDIKVSPYWKPEPTIKNAEDVSGLLMWSKLLPQGKDFNITYGYKLRYPEKKRIIGID